MSERESWDFYQEQYSRRKKVFTIVPPPAGQKLWLGETTKDYFIVDENTFNVQLVGNAPTIDIETTLIHSSGGFTKFSQSVHFDRRSAGGGAYYEVQLYDLHVEFDDHYIPTKIKFASPNDAVHGYSVQVYVDFHYTGRYKMENWENWETLPKSYYLEKASEGSGMRF